MNRFRRAVHSKDATKLQRVGFWATVLLAGALLFGRGLPYVFAAGYDWLQFNGNSQHNGNNALESSITPANVSTLQPLFQATLPAVADGAPAYLSGVSTASGTRDLVFLTTKTGHILALDAHTGATIWSHQNGPGTCQNQDGACYTTSSPAIDPNRQFVYSYGLEGYAHKYAVGTGAETIGGGWPELTTNKGVVEKESSALAIATSAAGATYLYVANGGYPGDFGDYQGHITAINLADGSQKVFNAVCSNLTIHFVLNGVTSGTGQTDCSEVQTAIWARPAVVYDSDTDRIYMATGNGTFDPGSFDWGDTVFALHADGTGAGNGNPLDSYTPTNFQQLQNNDADTGSTAPAIIKPVPAGSTVAHLAVQGGKDALLRLLNLDNLSGQGGVGHTGGEIGTPLAVPQGGEVLTQPVVWSNAGTTWVFVATGNGISGLTVGVNGGMPILTRVWQSGNGGASPLMANGVLYYAGGGLIRALDPTTGALKWSAGIGSTHWESPVVGNGVLYIADNNGKLNAFGLPASVTATTTATRTRTATTTSTPHPASTATQTPTSTPRPASTSTHTPTATITATATARPAATATHTQTRTATATATATPHPATATQTLTSTPRPAFTATQTQTRTATATATSTARPTATATQTLTRTSTASATSTPRPASTATQTLTRTATRTPTSTPRPAPSATQTSTVTASPTATPQTTAGSIAINLGGGAAGTFLADTDFTGGLTFSTTATIATNHVTNPAPQAVYQTQRYGNFSYKIRGVTPKGLYRVRLHFDEIQNALAGARVFDVAINGTTVLTNFDPYAAAGGPDIAIVEQFTTTAGNNGVISVTYTSVTGNATGNGIELLPAT